MRLFRMLVVHSPLNPFFTENTEDLTHGTSATISYTRVQEIRDGSFVVVMTMSFNSGGGKSFCFCLQLDLGLTPGIPILVLVLGATLTFHPRPVPHPLPATPLPPYLAPSHDLTRPHV